MNRFLLLLFLRRNNFHGNATRDRTSERKIVSHFGFICESLRANHIKDNKVEFTQNQNRITQKSISSAEILTTDKDKVLQ